MLVPTRRWQAAAGPAPRRFGIAKLVEGWGAQDGDQRALMGTKYMSPEQARGASQVDEPTDVYALGVMLFELLTDGRRSKASPASSSRSTSTRRRPIWPPWRPLFLPGDSLKRPADAAIDGGSAGSCKRSSMC